LRIASIDAIRGIAILGILLMNIPYHANLMMGYVPFEPSLVSDQIFSYIYAIFVDGRFRMLFCILFGVGLAIQYEYCDRHRIDANTYLNTRFKWLLLFGFIHALVLFGGDILMLYACVAMYAIKKLPTSDAEFDSKLLSKAIQLLIIGSLVLFVWGAVTLLTHEPSELITRDSETFTEQLNEWNGDPILRVISELGFALVLVTTSPLHILWQTMGAMYLGMYLYKSGFFATGFSPKALVKISLLALVTTLICLLPHVYMGSIIAEVNFFFSATSSVLVALIYAHVIVKICNRYNGFVRVFAPVGKLAFSLYILQSLAMSIGFTWLFPSFYSSATQLDYFGLVVVFSIIQILIAHFYLRHFKTGPLEALWRRCYQRNIQTKAED
jgi:uncharacterized protein